MLPGLGRALMLPVRTGSTGWDRRGWSFLQCAPMQAILEAIQAGASGDDIGNLPIPESYRAALSLIHISEPTRPY